MKEIKRRFDPFTALAIMMIVVVVFIAADIILSALDSANNKILIEQIYNTTTELKKISSTNNAILESGNRTIIILDELQEFQNEQNAILQEIIDIHSNQERP